LGEHRRAIADLDRAIDLDPQYAAAYHNRGIAYKKLGEYRRAIADYDRAIELNPQYTDAYYSRGLAHKEIGNRQQAIADFERHLQLPDTPEWHKQAEAHLRELRSG
jgi:tetratricopeptide (TPR) repeat protein